jgi:hypothetical protein
VTSLRAERDLSRGRRAAAMVRRSGGSAFEAACAHIESTFAPATRHSIYKDRVAAVIASGCGDQQVWTRYRRLAERYAPATLDGAIAVVERLWRAESEARAKAIRAWGYCGRPRLTLMILDELRLMLRLLRRHAPAHYSALLATILAAEAGSLPPSGEQQSDST